MKTRIPSILRSLRSPAICLALLCTIAMPAYAATQLVTNTDDSGFGSLRYVLADSMDGDTIDATGVSGTILLTSGELVVNKNLTINGPGADQLAVDGNGTSRVFHVIGPNKTVAISGLTITNGNLGGNGGGIFNDHATLTVSNCTLSDNFVSNTGVSMTGFGGGIYNDHAILTVSNCTVSGNTALELGGGIDNDGGESGSASVEILNSTLTGNFALAGGGIFNTGEFGSATLTVTNSTISGNSAVIVAGGIFNQGFSGSATLTLTNSTLSGNSADFGGGGIYNDGELGGSATLEIGDTILNAGASGENIANDSGTIISLGYNLSSDAAGGDGTTGPGGFLNMTGDIRNTAPMLGPLQDNGGPTFTHALLTGSPAIDMGDPSFTPPPDYDQRGPGFPRVANSRIDIGSFEVRAPTVCPQPQGYWKNNPDAWPVDHLTLGDQNYSKSDLLTILHTPVGSGKNGDASLILAYQLIAAKLNIANGSDPATVSATIDDADTLLSGFGGQLPYHIKPSSPSGHAMTNDANALANYNNTECTP